MARTGRIVLPGIPHHITQKGNNSQEIFSADADRVRYLDILRFQCCKHGLTMLGFCLMPNHVHLVAIPDRDDSLALAVGRSHGRYAQYFNAKHARHGHVWQDRFYSCTLGDAHVIHALKYVDRNPVRARLSESVADYAWSSARAHVGLGDPFDIIDLDG